MGRNFWQRRNERGNRRWGILFLIIVGLIGALHLLQQFIPLGITGFVIWQTSNQTSFDEGTYNNTEYNPTGGYVQLSGTNTSGTYTSKVFDATADSQWNNISWTQGGYYQQELPNNGGIETGLGGANMTGNVLLMHMNEQSANNGPNGTDVEDFSGNENHGNEFGGVTFGAAGKFNTALHFDGNDDYIEIPNSPEIDFTCNDSFTIEIWFKHDADEEKERMIGAGTETTAHFVMFDTGTTPGVSAIRFILEGDNGYGSPTIEDSTNYNDGKWHHAVGVYYGNGTAELFIDGISKGSSSPGCSGNLVNGASWRIGDATPFNDPAKFFVDELAIYNRTLSADEILDHYKRGALRLNLLVRSCDNASCSSESWQDVGDTSPQNLSVADNRYFQYKFEFETDDSSFTPELYNVTVVYTVLNAAPTVTLNLPANNSFTNINSALLNATVYDADSDNMTVWFYGDGILINTTYNQTNGTTLTFNWAGLSEGLHNWTVIANDGTVNSTKEHYYFTVDLTNPSLTVSYPVNGTSYKLHYYETTLDLNYTATDANRDSCWFINLTGQNETLASCSNGTINIPDNLNDNNYTITVYVNDSAGNLNSSQIFFTTDYSQGIMNGTDINMAGSEIVSIDFTINSTSTCINDWCENVTATLEYDSENCELRGSSVQSYNKGDLNATQQTSQSWKVRCNAVGVYLFTVKYIVQNGSVSQASQNISIQASAAKKVYETVTVGSQYERGDTVTIAVTLEDSNGNAVTGEKITAVIYYPNQTQMTSVGLPELVSGFYTNTITLSNTTPYGNYLVRLFSQSFSAVALFQVKPLGEYLKDINQTSSTILANIENVTRVVISDFGGVAAGDQYRVKVWVFDFQGKLKNATGRPTVTIYDPLRNIIVQNDEMSLQETGIYIYNFTPSSSHTDGVWETVVTVPVGSVVKLSDLWELESSPPEVKINSMIDTTIPTITADVTITNEGSGTQEYQYEYCVVAEESNTCGGGDDIDYASGAKLIQAGQSWNTQLTLDEVNQTGTLWFKLVVYFGTKKSGASQLFTATGAPAKISTHRGRGGTSTSQENITEKVEENVTSEVIFPEEKVERYISREIVKEIPSLTILMIIGIGVILVVLYLILRKRKEEFWKIIKNTVKINKEKPN